MKSYCKTFVLVLLLSGIMAGCSGGGGSAAVNSSPTNTTIATVSNSTATITVAMPPAVVIKSTDGSSCAVDTGVAISVIFSEDMIASSITNTTFTIDGISGTVAYNSSTRTATFTPSTALASSSSYTATITTSVKNSAGTAMANNYTWSFTTADPPASTPTLTLMGGAIQGNPLHLNANTVTTFAGSAGLAGWIDDTGSAARFDHPAGITSDGTNLYVVDSTNKTIRKIVIATGAVTTFPEIITTATGGGSGGGGGGAGVSIGVCLSGPGINSYCDLDPYGLTTDGTNLYVADFKNFTIGKIVIATGAVTLLAGSAGSSGSTDGTGTDARFYKPEGITTDGTNLYVADMFNHTIRKIVISTGAVTTLAGSAGNPGSYDATGTAAKFMYPGGITTDGTNLYVADSGNYTIRKIVIATGTVTTLAGSAGGGGPTDGTGTAAKFSSLRGITTDGTNLYVTDFSDYTIRKVVIATGTVTTLAGRAGSYGSTDGTGTAATFNFPYGVTTNGTYLYVTDSKNNTIRRISPLTSAPSAPTGMVATAGNGQATINWDNVYGAACYNIYCEEGSLVTTTTGTEIASVASPYVYSGLTNGITLTCIVTAVNPIVDGPPSERIPVTPNVTYTLSVSVSSSNNGSGTVTSSPSGINCGSTCMATVTNGATVTLTATPASGSTFAGWSGACSGTGSCTLLMDADKAATATFSGSTSSGGGGGGSNDCSYYYSLFRCRQSVNGVMYMAGLVPATCRCPSGTTYSHTDTVSAGGPWNFCACN